MIRIVIDRELQEQLLKEALVELVDETGKPIGSFMPFGKSTCDPSLIPPISPEEHARLMAEPGIYATADVLERLHCQ